MPCSHFEFTAGIEADSFGYKYGVVLMKQCFRNLLFLAVLGPIGAANAVVINGADLISDARVSLPTGHSGTVGTSLQFAGGAANRVLVNLDLSAFGIGTGVGQSATGSVGIDTTRITSDSDFWFGLWDGSAFTSVNFWDGDRINGVGYGTATATTHSGPSGGSTPPVIPVQAIGASITSLIAFDLAGDSISLTVGGASLTGSLGSLNVNADLSFLIGKGSVGETHQIDAVEIIGGDRVQVPEPSVLALLGIALAGFGFQRRRRVR